MFILQNHLNFQALKPGETEESQPLLRNEDCQKFKSTDENTISDDRQTFKSTDENTTSDNQPIFQEDNKSGN